VITSLTPKLKNIVGVAGRSRHGKDTVGRFIAERTGGVCIAFAEPMKEFVGAVFGFSDAQLYGSSEERNEFDQRFERSDDPAQMVAMMEHRAATEQRFFEECNGWLRDVLPQEVRDDGFRFTLARSRLHAWFFDAIGQPRINARRPLQTLGTEWGRGISTSLWIDLGFRRAEELLKKGVPLVVITDVRFINEAKAFSERGAHSLWKVTRPTVDGSHVAKAGIAGHASEAEIDSFEFEKLVNIGVPNDGSLEDLKRYVVTHCDIEWPR
jgi:hypothetical protein